MSDTHNQKELVAECPDCNRGIETAEAVMPEESCWLCLCGTIVEPEVSR